jgi:hypothetical protein
MRTLGLSFSLLVFAALAAPPAQAHFRPVFHPSPRIGPSHDRGSLDEFRRQRRDRGGSGGDWSALPDTSADAAPDAASAAPPQYVPVPIPVPVPYRPMRWVYSEPRLILLGDAERSRSQGPTPKVVYGDPLPKKDGQP